VRAVRAGLLAASVAGLAISLYLTSVHFGAAPLACTTGGPVNCEAVLSSRYATWFGVPTSAFGAAWFLAVLILTAVGGERTWLAVRALAWVGAATVVFLVYLELFQIGSLCLWCSILHLLILGILTAVEWSAAQRHEGASLPSES
jgi:uncharacterized membrane protein